MCLAARFATAQVVEEPDTNDPVRQYELPDVVVTGEFEPTTPEKAVHEIKVIDAEQIQTMGFQQLDEVLEQQLNLRVSRDPSLGAGLTMQGIDGNNIQIMIDGVPVIGRLDGNIDLSQLPLYNVERVEIVQGAMSNRYVTNAAGGVVNLITKKKDGASWSVTSQNQWENVGLMSNTLGVSGRLGRVMLSGSVFRYQSQLYSDDSLRASQSSWNPKEQLGGDAQIKYYGKKSLELGLSLRYFDELVRDLGEVKRPQFKPYSFDQYFYTRRIDPRFNVKFDMGRNHKFNSVSALNIYDRVSEDRRLDFENDSNYVIENGQDTSRFNTFLNRTIVTAKYGARWKAEYGLEARYETGSGERIVDSSSTPINQTQMTTVAGWAGAQYLPTERLTIQPGVRIGWNSNFDHPILPSVKAVYRGDKNLILRAGYARGFRAPDLKEQYLEFVAGNHDIHGNPNLEAENSHNAYIAAERELLTNEAHRALIRGRVFYNYIENQITRAQTSPLYYEYINVGRLWTDGVNAELDYKLYDDLTFVFGAGYTRAKSYSEELAELTDYIGTFDMNLQVTYIVPKIDTRVNLNFRYYGKQGWYSLSGEVLTLNEQEPHNMTHLSLAQGFWNDRIFLSAGVKNLFDIETVGGSRVSNSPHSPSGVELISWGRSYFAKLNVSLGPEYRK